MTRPLHVIADDIHYHWCEKISVHARPYLDAMDCLDSIHDYYGHDSGDSVVRYFLANATGWRGEHARRIKAELRGMLK